MKSSHSQTVVSHKRNRHTDTQKSWTIPLNIFNHLTACRPSLSAARIPASMPTEPSTPMTRPMTKSTIPVTVTITIPSTTAPSPSRSPPTIPQNAPVTDMMAALVTRRWGPSWNRYRYRTIDYTTTIGTPAPGGHPHSTPSSTTASRSPSSRPPEDRGYTDRRARAAVH